MQVDVELHTHPVHGAGLEVEQFALLPSSLPSAQSSSRSHTHARGMHTGGLVHWNCEGKQEGECVVYVPDNIRRKDRQITN